MTALAFTATARLSPANQYFPMYVEPPITKSQWAELQKEAAQQQINFRNWILSPITAGDDSAYVSVKGSIDSRVANGENLMRIFSDYRDRYFARRDDPVLLAGYAYSGYKMDTAVGNWETGPGQNGCGCLYIAIGSNSVDMPHTYEASRIVFLCDARSEGDQPFKNLGLSLLQRNPDDWEVKFCFAEFLDFSDSAEDRSLGAQLLQQVIRHNPRDPRNYMLLGDQQLKFALVNKSVEDAEACTAFYRRYLESEPKNSPDVQTINIDIGTVNILIKKWTNQQTVSSGNG